MRQSSTKQRKGRTTVPTHPTPPPPPKKIKKINTPQKLFHKTDHKGVLVPVWVLPLWPQRDESAVCVDAKVGQNCGVAHSFVVNVLVGRLKSRHANQLTCKSSSKDQPMQNNTVECMLILLLSRSLSAARMKGKGNRTVKIKSKKGLRTKVLL